MVPEVAFASTVFRVLATLLIFACHAALRWHPLGQRYPEMLMCAIVLTTQAHSAWLMPQSGEALAFYFAGYAVMIYGFAALIPGRIVWPVTAASLSVAVLMISLFSIPANNVMANLSAMYIFAAGMILISVLSSLNSWRLHYNQFQARQALLEEKERTDKLLEELEHASRRDPLTNLANRRYWQEALGQAWAKDEAMCLAIIDIDYFKSINDLFGHQMGDDILIAVSRILEESVAEHGFVARLGGDEFSVLLLGDNVELHMGILTNIMRKVKTLVLKGMPETQVTLSVGVAVREEITLTTSDLMQQADRQLYLAKASRNTIAVEGQRTITAPAVSYS